MKRKFSFEISMISATLFVLILVVSIGILTYNSLRSIVADVEDATRPNTRIELLKQVIVELTEAENSIKTYRLTGDDNYLQPFYNSITSVDERMVQLQMQSRGDLAQAKLADSVRQLVTVKYEILYGFLNLESNEKITSELENISQRLKEAEKVQRQAAKAKTKAEEENKPTIFQKIFGTKKEEKPAAPPPPPMNLGMVKKEVENVQKNQAKQLQKLKQQELALNRDDRLVMDKIQLVMQRMENNEKTFYAHKRVDVAKKARDTNFYILLFCLLTTGLLTGLSFSIYTYIQKNKAYGAALRKAKKQAETLAKTKENFLANMSHEIRTPMNAISGFTSQVLQSKLNKQQSEQLQVVKKSADHLLHIINEILDYSKIQSGKFNFDTIGFKPSEIVDEVIAFTTPGAQQKKLVLQSTIAPSVPQVLVGDPVRLRQILLNIVGNAVKFTEKGSIRVNVSAVNLGDKAVTLQFIVDDTGVGISEENIRKIFNEFEQADTSISRKYGGTGLGLTITRKLIEMQNGTIDIKSKPGKGTKVTIVLPYKEGAVNNLKSDAGKAIEYNLLRGKNILVADDEEYNRLLINTILRKWGTNTTLVANGADAINAAKDKDFDVILMDVRMPKMDGIEASKNIRSFKQDIPIIALTAITLQKDIDDCYAAGMTGIVSKPFNEDELYSALVELLNPHANPFKKIVAGKPITEPAETARYDLEELKHLANGEVDFVKEMIHIFINTTREGIKNMEAALVHKKWNELADNAHKIVPPCRHLKANKLLNLLKTIELQIREEGRTDNLDEMIKAAKKEGFEIIALLEIEMEKMEKTEN